MVQLLAECTEWFGLPMPFCINCATCVCYAGHIFGNTKKSDKSGLWPLDDGERDHAQSCTRIFTSRVYYVEAQGSLNFLPVKLVIGGVMRTD